MLHRELLVDNCANFAKQENRRALEKPDVEGIFLYPQLPSVIVRNKSLSKVAQGVMYQARFLNLSKPQGEQYEFTPSRVRDVGTIRPDGSFGPFAFELLFGQSAAALTKGERLFGYVTVQCLECKALRVYWMYVQFGEYGLYHEGTYNEFDFYHFGLKDENKLSKFMKSWKLPTSMPMQYP